MSRWGTLNKESSLDRARGGGVVVVQVRIKEGP